MRKLVLEESLKTEEGRLKVKRIRKLTMANKIFTATRFTGMMASVFVDYLCLLSVFAGAFNLESNNSIFVVALAFCLSHKFRDKFYYEIPVKQEENYQEIFKIANELSEEIARAK